jgi:hypothetical protein
LQEATDLESKMIDWVEVSRVSHQLSLDHGQRAYLYAEGLAKEASQNENDEIAAFWKAVSAALAPRGQS